MSCVIVMGCYRSGTSAVAGILHHLGVYMGENFHEPNFANPKGYFEDPEFMKVNLKLYESGKCLNNDNLSEQDWKVHNDNVDEFHQLCYARETYSSLGIWGFKDPKFCLTAKYVMHEIAQPPMSETAKIIWIHRNVDDTIRSLIKTLGLFGKDASFQKWRNFVNHYITEAGRYIANHPANNVLDIKFEDLMSTYRSYIAEIANFLDLPTTPQAFDFMEAHRIRQLMAQAFPGEEETLH